MFKLIRTDQSPHTFFVMLFLLLVTFGCTKENESIDSDKSQTFEEEEIIYNGKYSDFAYTIIDGENIFQGDIVLSEEEINEMKILADLPEDQRKSLIRSNKKYRWTNNIVHFTITPNINNRIRQLIALAIEEYETNTNLVFDSGRTYGSYIEFSSVSGTNSSSRIGMGKGRQKIKINDDAPLNTVIHEIGHAIGLYHEHTRRDRDNHVIINWANIRSGFDNFLKTWKYFGTSSGPFDINSVMMYGPWSFSKWTTADDGLWIRATATITRLDGSTNWERGRIVSAAGDRAGLSLGDIASINAMYPFHPCTNTPCCRVTCIQGYTCVNGDCVIDISNPPNCDGSIRSCPPGERCFGGNCVPL